MMLAADLPPGAKALSVSYLEDKDVACLVQGVDVDPLALLQDLGDNFPCLFVFLLFSHTIHAAFLDPVSSVRTRAAGVLLDGSCADSEDWRVRVVLQLFFSELLVESIVHLLEARSLWWEHVVLTVLCLPDSKASQEASWLE